MEDSSSAAAKRCNSGDDRLSPLPDEILGEIIARLNDLKLAARTSMLSKRWRSLWTSIPNISITWPDLDHRYSFAEFAAAVLDRRHGAPIRRLCVHICGSYSEAFTWLRRALQHNVEELVVEPFFVGYDPEDYVKIITVCKSLRVLELSLDALPDLRVFHNLTTLKLNNVLASDTEFGEELKNNPALHVLSLKNCYFKAIKISNSSLKELTLHNCMAIDFVLCTPRLMSLDLDVWCFCFDSFYMTDLLSLRSATLSIRGCERVATLREILGGLKYARLVILLEFTFEPEYITIPVEISDLPTFTFCNLEHLEICKWKGDINYKLRGTILFNVPKLETLVLLGAEDQPQSDLPRKSYGRQALVNQVKFERFDGDATRVLDLLKLMN